MKKYSCLFFVLIIFLFTALNAYAAPEDVSLIPLTRYYPNKDCYGFYEMCGESSWLGMVFHNNGTESASVTFPSEVRIGGTSGTRHNIDNLQYREVSPNITNFIGTPREGTKFNSSFTIPSNGTYAVFLDIHNIGYYTNQYNTDVFFTVKISSGGSSRDKLISGPIAQRGTSCPADQVCSAKVLNGNYNADGSGTVTVSVRNDMPMTTQAEGKSDVTISWTDKEGKKQTQKFDNAVTWNQNPGWMESGSEKTVSGTLALPVEISAAANTLTLTFHFWHPSSLFFGDFYGQAKLYAITGLNGSMTGNFDTDGKNGSFTAVINNNQTKNVSLQLPSEGKVSDASGKSAVVTLTWNRTTPLNIAPQGSASVSGTFSFKDTGLIHANSSLILSIDLQDGESKGTAAGTITRNADPNPILKTAGNFCRDYTAGSDELTFSYALKNEANIDIQAELASTLAIPGQVPNPKVTYTSCQSSGANCFSRISGGIFTIEPGETAKFTGKVKLETPYPATGTSIETSLRYFADGEKHVLYIGKTTDSCTVQPETETTVTPAVPTQSETETPVTPAAPIQTTTETPVTPIAPLQTETETPVTSTDQEPDDPKPLPNLEFSVPNSYYNLCERDTAVHFTLKIHNSGTASGYANLTSIKFSQNGNQIPSAAVSFNSCAEMSVSGTDTMHCAEELKSGRLTIDPNVTVTVEGSYQPQQTITQSSISVTVMAAGMIPEQLSFTASAVGTGCTPKVAAVKNKLGDEISASVSDAKDTVTLLIQLVNTGTGEAIIKLGSINLHQTSIEDYTAVLVITPISEELAEKELQTISAGTEFTLPAMSSATLSVSMKIDLADAFSNTARVSWNIRIGNTAENLTGTINFSQPAPTVNTDPAASSHNRRLNFHTLGEPQLPELLPATGFPTHGPHVTASIQPSSLSYEELNGLHMEIPVINAGMDLVRIPLDENNEWAVEWLNNQAGILSYSRLPGQGTSVIAGHNHLDEMNVGPFLMLWQLENNDRIFITDNDGEFLMYAVYANELINPTDSDLIYQKAIPGSLVLLTCENEMPEGGYAYRRAIFAEPLQ